MKIQNNVRRTGGQKKKKAVGVISGRAILDLVDFHANRPFTTAEIWDFDATKPDPDARAIKEKTENGVSGVRGVTTEDEFEARNNFNNKNRSRKTRALIRCSGSELINRMNLTPLSSSWEF